jgi:RHS repeat-associated protein
MYAGQYFDAETELHYNLNRYYDPVTGIYLRTDPFGDGPGEGNMYLQCEECGYTDEYMNFKHLEKSG